MSTVKLTVPQCSETLKSNEYCACKKIRCMSRKNLEYMQLVIIDYENTAKALEKCQDKTCKECKETTPTWKIVLISVGVGIGASVGGYFMGKYL